MRDQLPPLEGEDWLTQTIVVPPNSTSFIDDVLEEQLAGDLGGGVEIHPQDKPGILLLADEGGTIPVRYRRASES